MECCPQFYYFYIPTATVGMLNCIVDIHYYMTYYVFMQFRQYKLYIHYMDGQ